MEIQDLLCSHRSRIVNRTQSLDAISFILNMNPEHGEHEHVRTLITACNMIARFSEWLTNNFVLELV